MEQQQPQGTKRCPFCAEEIQVEAVKCRFCGQWLTGSAAPSSSVAVQATAPAPPAAWQGPLPPQSSGVYAEGFNLQTVSPELRSKYAQHTLTSTFEVAGVVVLGIITANIFSTIYFALKHGKLPRIASDDPSGGKAVGFIFIPVFNFYWIFFMWIRLVDRINFQFRLRNQQPPVSRGMAVAIPILTITSLIPFVGIVTGVVNWLILVPIFASQLQGAINWLATESATVRGQVGATR